MRIKVHLRSNCNQNFHTVFIYDISERNYRILKNYESDEYDEVWDKLCDDIEQKSVPGTLDPDWYIDYIEFC